MDGAIPDLHKAVNKAGPADLQRQAECKTFVKKINQEKKLRERRLM